MNYLYLNFDTTTETILSGELFDRLMNVEYPSIEGGKKYERTDLITKEALQEAEADIIERIEQLASKRTGQCSGRSNSEKGQEVAPSAIAEKEVKENAELPRDSKDTSGEDQPGSGEDPEGSKEDGGLSGRNRKDDTGGRGSDLRADEEGQPTGRPDQEDGGAEHAEDVGKGDSDVSHERVPEQSGRVTNYHITDDDHDGEGGWKKKAKDNLAAIRTLKTILEENR